MSRPFFQRKGAEHFGGFLRGSAADGHLAGMSLHIVDEFLPGLVGLVGSGEQNAIQKHVATDEGHVVEVVGLVAKKNRGRNAGADAGSGNGIAVRFRFQNVLEARHACAAALVHDDYRRTENLFQRIGQHADGQITGSSGSEADDDGDGFFGKGGLSGRRGPEKQESADE